MPATTVQGHSTTRQVPATKVNWHATTHQMPATKVEWHATTRLVSATRGKWHATKHHSAATKGKWHSRTLDVGPTEVDKTGREAQYGVTMPLSSVVSYLSTMDEFITHWLDWNAQTSANNTLPGGFKAADLQTMRDNLQTAITAVETPRNQLQAAGAARDLKKGPLIERLRQMKGRVLGELAGTTYASMLPHMPNFTAGEGVFLRAMDDMQSLWVQINSAPPAGFTAPLKLVGNYTAANHAADIASLRASYTAYNTALQTVELKLGARNEMLPPIKFRLVQYRQVIQGSFPAGHNLILSLPKVTPNPGSTPKAVGNLSAVWNAGTLKAVLTWTPSASPSVTEYQIRSCDPPTYRVGEEVVLGTVSSAVFTFATDDGLGVSGAAKLFKVYAVTGDGNEKGSKAVKVTRP